MPWTEAEGWVDFEISLNGGPFYWKGRIYVEPPNVSPELVWFDDEQFHLYSPGEMILRYVQGDQLSEWYTPLIDLDLGCSVILPGK